MSPSGDSATGNPPLLLVDDDREMLGTLTIYFRSRGFNVAAASNVAEAKEQFARQRTWKLVVTDFHLPDGTGWDLCTWMREQVSTMPPLLLMSGSVETHTLALGVPVLAKPFALSDLEARVKALLKDDR